jgi:hypothetical protein
MVTVHYLLHFFPQKATQITYFAGAINASNLHQI